MFQMKKMKPNWENGTISPTTSQSSSTVVSVLPLDLPAD